MSKRNERTSETMRFQLTPLKIVMLVLLLGLSAYYSYNMQQIRKANQDPVIDAIMDHTLPEKPTATLPALVTIDKESQIGTPQKAPIAITLSEREDLKSWNLSHGYPFSKDAELYETYSSALLNDMAKNNDILALDVLAGRAVHEADYERAILLYWKAAALGSTAAFGQLSLLMAPQPDHKGDVEYGKPKLLESLAVLKTAALRGDIRIASVDIKFIKKDYEHYFGPLTLSDQDLSKIDQLAQRNYDNIQKMRNDLGLGEFENSTPKFLQDMYGK